MIRGFLAVRANPATGAWATLTCYIPRFARRPSLMPRGAHTIPATVPLAGAPSRGVPLPRRGMFTSLAIRDFRFLWLSSLAASFAMQMQMVARGWLIYDMTSSPLALTWVMLSFMLPTFLFSLAGGVIADRMRKKSIMVTSQLLNTGATVLLATIVYAGDVTFWHFIWFGLFNGTVLSISMPARFSVAPEIVGQERVVNAMALQSATFNLSRILGPALAGGLIALFASGDTASMAGVGLVFYVIAGLSLVSVACTALLRYRGDPTHTGATSVAADLREGFRYMRDQRVVLGLLIVGFVPMTFGFVPTFLMPAFNADVIGGGPDDLGLLMTAMGVGALFGSLVLARLGDIRRKGPVMFAAAYVWAVFLVAFALSTGLLTAMLAGAFVGLASSLMGSLNMSAVQLAVRPEIRGRVMAIMMMTHGLAPIGLIPISAAAEFVGIEVAILGSAILLAVSMALLGVYFPELRRMDRGHAREEPHGHTGPEAGAAHAEQGRSTA